MSNCDKYRQLINEGFEGGLSDEDASALSSHFESCAECRADFELGNFADGLMLAVAAPEIDAEVWQFRAEALGISGDDDLGLPADAIKPPDVSDEEWDSMWLDIERSTLLDGIGGSGPIAPATGKIRRIRLRRVVSAFSAAAVLVIAVVSAYIYLVPHLPQHPPRKSDDVIMVSDGYLYSKIDVGGQYPVYEIALTDDVRDVEHISAGKGYLKSVGDSSAPEITAVENMRNSKVSADKGYLHRRMQGSEVDEIGDCDDLDTGGYEEIPEFPQEEPSVPGNASGDGNN